MKNFLTALLVGLVCTTIITWPFLPNIASYYTDQGDYATHGSIFWWNQDSIKTGRIFKPQEYWQGYMFYPHPYSFAFANTSVFPSLVFAPFYWITGNLPFSFNLYLFLSFVGSFMAAFYTIRYFLSHMSTSKESKPTFEVFGINNLASLAGAFIYTFNPQTMTRFPQHVDILDKYFLPLIFLFAYKAFKEPNFKNAFFLALFFTLNSLTTNYFQIFSIVMLPLVFIPFLVTMIRGRDWKYLVRLGKSGVVGLVFLPILLYFNLPLWNFAKSEGALRTVEESTFFSARLNDFFAPSENNLIYGGWARYLFQFREPKDNRGILNYEEHTIFIGILATILFIIGIKPFLKIVRPVRNYLLILLVLPFIFLFGPFLGSREDGLKLPFYYFYKIFPVMQGIRAPTRFEYVFLIPFSIIAAFGAKSILEKVGKRREIFVIGTVAVVLILENYTIKDFSERSEVFQVFDRQMLGTLSFLSGKTTLHLPIYTTDDADVFGKNSYATNWATRTGERLVNGNSGYLPPDHLGLQFGIRENLDRQALEILSALGTDYVVFHKNSLSSEEKAGFARNYSLYKEGSAFEDDGLLIVRLSRFAFEGKRCDFLHDFDARVVTVDNSGSYASHALILDNKSDCYLFSGGTDRYRKLEVEVDGGVKAVKFRMPLIVVPGEQVILSTTNRDLSIE